MVIPTQPPLTATKKSTPKPQAPGIVSSVPPPSVSLAAKPQSHTAPQPVAASYATASTPSQPTFNVQVRSAQPGPQHQAPGGHHFGQHPNRSPAQVQYMPAQPKSPDFAYGPPQPGFSPLAQGSYQDQQYPGGHQLGGSGSRRAEPAPAQLYQPQGPKKTYITDVPQSLAPYNSGPAVPPKVRTFKTRTQQFLIYKTCIWWNEMNIERTFSLTCSSCVWGRNPSTSSSVVPFTDCLFGDRKLSSTASCPVPQPRVLAPSCRSRGLPRPAGIYNPSSGF